jgi:hypothetical protein
MHSQRNGILQAWPGVCQRKIENTLGFQIQAARHIETGKIDPGRRALVGLGSRGSGDKRILSRDEIFGLIFAPVDDV